MILNNLNQDGCGSLKKCQSCTFNLICYKSPLCKIKNFEVDNGNTQDIVRYINSLSENVRILNLSLQSVIEQQNTILDIMCKQKDINPSTSADVDVDNTNNQEDDFSMSLIVPNNSNDDEKVLVEKRTLFGKKKWVEQKQ